MKLNGHLFVGSWSGPVCQYCHVTSDSFQSMSMCKGKQPVPQPVAKTENLVEVEIRTEPNAEEKQDVIKDATAALAHARAGLLRTPAPPGGIKDATEAAESLGYYLSNPFLKIKAAAQKAADMGMTLRPFKRPYYRDLPVSGQRVPVCECGAAKALGVQNFAPGHSHYCPVKK